jgi:hypothetical protein
MKEHVMPLKNNGQEKERERREVTRIEKSDGMISSLHESEELAILILATWSVGFSILL